MRLWLDGQCLQTNSRLRGIGRYVSELIRTIAQTCPEVEMSISFNAAMTEAGVLARDAVSPWITPGNIHVWQGAAPLAGYRPGHTRLHRLEEIALAHHVACLAPDIALCPSPFEGLGDEAAPFLSAAGHAIPRAAIFHDATPHRYPQRYLRQPRIAAAYKHRLASLRNFDHLLAVSGFARSEAMALLPDTEVVQIDAGVSPDFIALSRMAGTGAAARLGLRKPFMLYVGALDWHKNLPAAIEACALLPAPWRDALQFVLAGRGHPADVARVRAAWRRTGLPPANLVLLDHVGDAALVQLYAEADLVIQPSLLEGFGLTALEAMQCGAPVIAANTGALPEVVGDARCLFDPTQPSAIAARITEVLNDPALARSLVEHGLARAREYSWPRTARLAVAALQRWSRPAPRPDLATLRGITRGQLAAWSGDGRAASLLAAAEPPTATPARLLVDVTSTSYNDPGTGIQRVVNSIARSLPHKTPHRLFWCDSPAGFFAAQFGPAGKLQRQNGAAHHIIPHRNHILMLDSSWDFTPVYDPVMARARLQGCEIISVLYDLVPLKMPAFCDAWMSDIFVNWIASALGYSAGFVCISRAVADEFHALLEAIQFPHPLRIGYWRLGADLSMDLPAPAAGPLSQSAPMFLMIATLEPRKGHRLALDAFTALWRDGFDGTLCLIGKRGWGVEHLVADLKAHPEWGGKLIWLEGASDAVLEAHYAACTALIVPSYAEGFGLPIVEAFRHGKPVIASDIAVFREVAGDGAAVRYFEMGSSQALAAAVRDFKPGPVSYHEPSVTWTQSAAALEDIVMGQNWYRHYQPKIPSANGRPAPRDEREQRYRLELVEGPIATLKGRKFIIRVTNLSENVWPGAGKGAVALAIRRPGGKARLSKIPLVHPPGETLYIAVELTEREIGRARQADIALVQDDNWWDGGLRVSLD